MQDMQGIITQVVIWISREDLILSFEDLFQICRSARGFFTDLHILGVNFVISVGQKIPNPLEFYFDCLFNSVASFQIIFFS